MIKRLRNAFISGILLLAPVGVTLFVLKILIETVGAPTRDLFFPFLAEELNDKALVRWVLNIISVFIVIVLITIFGWFSQMLIGRFALQTMERLIARVPIIRTVYSSVKQIVDTFSQQQRAVFQQVVLVEFPRPKCYAIGFLTAEGRGEVQDRTKHEIVNIFLPTTPNPTSGYLLMIPREDVTNLDMSVTDGMKLIISGGAVVPPWNAEEAVIVENPPSNRDESRVPNRDQP